jgi:hypothetical protein
MVFFKISILNISFALMVLALAPEAESSESSSMSHRVLSHSQSISEKIEVPTPLYNAKDRGSSGVQFLSRTHKKQEFDTNFNQGPDLENASENTQRVWDKYKNLAAGLEPPEELAVKKEDPVTEATLTVPQAKKAGIANIIDQYYANKESRNKMRVLRLNEPKNTIENTDIEHQSDKQSSQSN